MGDLSSRRGMVQGMEDMAGGSKVVKAEVPLAEMFGYSTALRSQLKAVRPIRWNSSIIPKRRRMSLKRSLSKK